MTALLTRRVLPNDAAHIREQLQAMAEALQAGPLGSGARGDGVLALQKHLAAAGLYSGQPSGVFDAATEAALRKFQAACALNVTGRLDRASLKQLREINLFVKDGFEPAARQGQRGKDILGVEKRLARLGFLERSEADGVYDRQTKHAVAWYRHADKEVEDDAECIGKRFASELKEAAQSWDHAPWRRRSMGHVKAHRRLDALTAERAASEGGLRRGDHGRGVLNVQRHLEAAGFEIGGMTEEYGRRTEAAVREFQRKMKLPETGVVNARTWKELRRCSFAASDATSPAQALGEKSGQVKRTETLLKALGHKQLAADGLFGTRTERAVKRFQENHDLKVTGRVNEKTLGEIREVFRNRTEASRRPSIKGYQPLPQVSWRDGLDRYSQEMYSRFQDMCRRMGIDTGAIRIAQGTYSTGVGQSGGTHDRGGAVDLYAPADQFKKIMRAAAKVGWAPFDRRTMAPPHIHMVALGHPDAAWDANDQIRDFFLGRNGLVDHSSSADSARLRNRLPAWAKKMRDRYVRRDFP